MYCIGPGGKLDKFFAWRHNGHKSNTNTFWWKGAEMKRGVGTLAALTLCLALTGTALAECTLTRVGSVENADLLRDSNLLRVRTQAGYTLTTLEGEPLTQDAYGNVEIQHGYIVAATTEDAVNTWGALDAQGSEVIPFQYGDIEFLSTDWALAYTLVEATADHYDYTTWLGDEAYYLIGTVDVYSLSAGACVATLPRENFQDAEVVGTCINIEDRSDGTVTTYDADFQALGTVDYVFDEDYADADRITFRENGQYGLMDAEGNVIMEPSFYSIYDFEGDYAAVSTGDAEGLIDRMGRVIVPAEYEDIKRSYYLPYDVEEGTNGYNAHGYFGVEKDGKLGFVREGGEVTCEPTLSSDVMDFYGASATYTDLSGAVHILAADGTDTAVEGYESMYCADYSGGMLYKVCDADYNYGVIDWHGQVVLPCEYDGVDFSADGRYLLADVSYEESEIFEITYSAVQDGAAAQPAEQKDPAAIKDGVSGGAQNAQEPAAAGNDAVITLLDQAAAQLESDAEGNQAAISALLDSAALLLGEDNASAASMLESASTLLEAGAAQNAASIVTILNSVKDML